MIRSPRTPAPPLSSPGAPLRDRRLAALSRGAADDRRPWRDAGTRGPGGRRAVPRCVPWSAERPPSHGRHLDVDLVAWPFPSPVPRLALLEHGQHRRGDEDRRVGAGEEADEEGEGELLERGRPEDEGAQEEQRRHREQGRDRGVQRSHQHLVQRLVDHVAVGEVLLGAHQGRVLVDLVEHDDAVVDREAEDRQQGHHRGRGDLEPRDRVHADR